MAKQTFTTGQVLTAAQLTNLQQTALGGGSPSVKTTSYVLVAADAGTVIQMNSTSATTVTVNTGLFSSGDSVQIQNIGAGTMTITAGTATVNSAGSLAVSQYDGGFLYFSSASSAIWFDYTQPGTTSPLTTKGDLYTRTSSGDTRLGVGANGTTLVADSAEATGLKWATASSGGPNFTLLNAGGTALTGATTITVSFTAKDYLFVRIVGGNTGTTNSILTMRLNADSGANYPQVRWHLSGSSGGTYSPLTNFNDSATSFLVAQLGETPDTFSSFHTISGAKASGIKTYQGRSHTDKIAFASNYASNGLYSGSADITSVSIISSSGNFTAGTIYVYGA